MSKPDFFGKYQIDRVLGRGGMGTVYEAIDPVIHRKVALKTMMPHLAGNPDLRKRFLREAQAAGRLRHRNIVTVYDTGEDDGGQPYIAMEFIDGTDLEKIIQHREPVSVDWKLDVLRQICDGLGHAHRAGVVHRDVKPGNIRVTADAEVKIMDFGIAHLQSSNTMTKGGLVMGTLQYMAPEVVDGRKPDHRADIFSVGAIAYEMLSGHKPFEADSLSAVMYKITHERADPRRLPRTRHSPALERVIMKALARELGERYQNLDEMRGDILALLSGNVGGLIAVEDQRHAAELVQKGRRYLSAADSSAALECAKDALSVRPGDPAAIALATAAAPPPSPEDEADAKASEKKKVLDELIAEMERARQEGQLQKALSLCRKIVELSPDDDIRRQTIAEIDGEIKAREVEQLLGVAVNYAREGDFTLSAKIAAKIEKIDPENAKLKDLQQFLSEETGRRESEALVATAKEHLALGNLEEAIAAAEAALDSNPNQSVAREIRDGASRLLSMRQPNPPSSPEPVPQPAAEPEPARVPEAIAEEAPAAPAPAPVEAAPPAPVVEAPPPPTAATADEEEDIAVADDAAAAMAALEPERPVQRETEPAPDPEADPVLAALVDAPPVPAPAIALPPPEPAPISAPKPFSAPRPAPALAASAKRSSNFDLTALVTPPPVTIPAPSTTPAPSGASSGTPAEVATLLDTALNHFLMNENKKAKRAIEKVLAIDPRNRKALELSKKLGA